MVFQIYSPYFWMIFFVVFIAFLYWRWTHSRFVQQIDALPGPKTSPIIGNVLDFIHLDPEDLFTHFFNVARQYGAISRFWIANQPLIFIMSPELIKPILCSHKLIKKSKRYEFLKPIISESLFVITGEQWKKRRSLITPAFHLKLLQGTYLDVFNKKSLDYTNQLEKQILTNQVSEVDVSTFIGDLTIDITLEALMGYQTINSKEGIEHQHNIEWFENTMITRILNPFLWIDSIFWLTLLGRKTNKIGINIKNFANKLIEHRREVLKNEKMDHDKLKTEKDYFKNKKNEMLPFLDLLIEIVERDKENLTEQNIQEEVNVFIQGATDTTASAVSWLLYCLARHPEEQHLVVNELTRVFGSNNNRPCTYKDISELKYLECCIKETLRLYPSFPNVQRELTEDIAVGNYTLPAGAVVNLSLYEMHRNPKVFQNPDSFKPERFLPEKNEGTYPYAFIPFSAGPRNCIGSKFAMIQMKTILSFLLRHFHFSSLVNPSQPLLTPRSSSLIIRPKEINLTVTKRAQTGV